MLLVLGEQLDCTLDVPIKQKFEGSAVDLVQGGTHQWTWLLKLILLLANEPDDFSGCISSFLSDHKGVLINEVAVSLLTTLAEGYHCTLQVVRASVLGMQLN